MKTLHKAAVAVFSVAALLGLGTLAVRAADDKKAPAAAAPAPHGKK